MGFTEEIHRGNLDQMCLNIINKYPFLTVYSWITELLGRDGVDVGNTSVVPEQKSLSLSLSAPSLSPSLSPSLALSLALSLSHTHTQECTSHLWKCTTTLLLHKGPSCVPTDRNIQVL